MHDFILFVIKYGFCGHYVPFHIFKRFLKFKNEIALKYKLNFRVKINSSGK